MDDPDRIVTAARSPETESRIRGSRFLGIALPAASEAEWEEALESVRRVHPHANHHCWAVISDRGERSSDDGEPGGSAGEPILRVLRGSDLAAVGCVVTRYFGGTKLGTGGLVRAYTEAAQDALQAAPRIVRWREKRLGFRFDYPDLGVIEATLHRFGDAILDTTRTFDPHPEIILRVKRSRADEIAAAIVDGTAGRATPH